MISEIACNWLQHQENSIDPVHFEWMHPEFNASIALPIADRDFLVGGVPLEQYRRHPVVGKHLESFIFQAGQPPEVWAAYSEAMRLA